MVHLDIGAREFRRRFESLCLGGVGPGLPRRRRDAQILLKAASLALVPHSPCSEAELDNVLDGWLWAVGPRVELDRVGLRRSLVDEGYLLRDSAGRSYRLGPGPAGVSFAADIDEIDPIGVVEEARNRQERARALHQSRDRREVD